MFKVTLNINVFLRLIVQIITTLIFMFTLAPPLMACSFVSIPVVVTISKKYGAQLLSGPIADRFSVFRVGRKEGLAGKGPPAPLDCHSHTLIDKGYPFFLQIDSLREG